MSEVPHNVRVATHEAGHSTISRVVGLPSGEATIKDGQARSYLSDDDGVRSVLTAMAGGIAEEVLLGSAVKLGCKDDDEKVTRLLGDIGFTDSALTRRAIENEC